MHKNKTFATLLAFLLGGIGLHRFYVHGRKDFWGWAHLATLPIALLGILAYPDKPLLLVASLLLLSVIAGLIEALVMGLTPDEQWDAAHNRNSGRQSRSGWPLAILLVLTLGVGAVVLIGTMARAFDLLYTGGAYG